MPMLKPPPFLLNLIKIKLFPSCSKVPLPLPLLQNAHLDLPKTLVLRSQDPNFLTPPARDRPDSALKIGSFDDLRSGHLAHAVGRRTLVLEEGGLEVEMKVLIGSPGTISGLMLRIGQCMFAAASIGVMVSALGFSNYTAFCYLIASMGLQVLWSMGLACLDIYALRMKRDLHSPVLVSLFVVGDWVTATLSLAAACSSAGVAVLFAKDVGFCKLHKFFGCPRYEISISLAFMTWLLIAKSSLVMFWLLASV